MDVSPKSCVTCARCKRSIPKDEVSGTIRYDESLVGTKLKVWSHKDRMYYEGVITEYYPDWKKHKELNTDEIGKGNDVKESEKQNENVNHVIKAEKEAVIPPEKNKDTIQEFSPKAVESKHAATANVSSPFQRNNVLDERSVWSNKEKPVPQEVESASPSKSRSPPDETRVKEMNVYPKSVSKSASKEGSSTKTLVTNAKQKSSSASRAKVSDSIKYDESLVGTKLEVWWPADEKYYEGIVAKFYPDKKLHKVLYADGDVEILDLRTEIWKLLKEFSAREDKGHSTKVQSHHGTPDIHKNKKPKTDPAASQEKIKDSAVKVGDVSSSDKLKGSTPKDNQSTQETSGKSCDAATTASKEAAKSKEVVDTGKTVNKLNGKERLRLEAERLRIKADKVKSKIRLQEERLRLEAEKMKLLKKDSDVRIMMIDATVMPEMKRLYFEELQREIIMRRSYA